MTSDEERYAYPPRGLDHDAAARYVGISPAAFDDLLRLQKLPGPRQVGSALVWDRQELDDAFSLFPPAEVSKARRVSPSAEFEGYPNVYTPETLAERWRCSGQHVRNMIKRGDLEAWKLPGRLLRISPKAVIEFEARGF